MDNIRLDNLADHFKGSLIAGAAGDALGGPVEFMRYDQIVRKYGEGGIRRLDKADGVARITDDTQMTLFTANGLLVQFTRRLQGDMRPIPDVVYRAYLDWYRAVGGRPEVIRPNVSWLSGVPELLHDRASGMTCTSAMRSAKPRSVNHPINGSCGCGGVMRIAPYALQYGKRVATGKYYAFLSVAAEIGAITHGDSRSHLACGLAATIIALCIYGDTEGAPTSLREATLRAIEIVRNNAPDWEWKADFMARMDVAVARADNDMSDVDNIHAIGGGWRGDEAIAIVVYCLLRHADFSECLAAAVNHDGDSDSTGAITGNILGAFYGYDAIPDAFKCDIEIQSVIEQLATDLALAADPKTDPAVFNAETWLSRYNYPLD